MTDLEQHIARITWGDHVCCLYEKAGEPLGAAAIYLKEGLRRGEACYYVADEHSPDEVLGMLAAAGVDVAGALAANRLKLIGAAEYCPPGDFDPAAMIEHLRGIVSAEIAAGAPGLRVVVDMTWALTAGIPPDGLLAYESLGTELVESLPASALCLYNRQRFGPELMNHLMTAHPMVMARGAVLRNIFYEPPSLLLARHADDRRLEYRLQQLWRARDIEEQQLELAGREREARAEMAKARSMEFFAESSAILASSLDYEDTLDRLVRLAVREAADFALADILGPSREVARVATAHRDPAMEPVVRKLKDYPPCLDVAEGVASVLRSGEPLLVRDPTMARWRGIARDETHLALIQQLAPRSVVVAPLRARGTTLGALTLGSVSRPYDEQDLAFLAELANRAALAVDNARLYHEAQEAIRRRDEVLAIVSHDLRNPLNAVHMIAELLREVPASRKDLAKHAESITKATRQALKLIEELLLVARIESGAAASAGGPCDLRSVVRDVLDLYQTYASGKRIALTADLPSDVPLVSAEAEPLAQVLTNLVDNAVKFTDRGDVVVRVLPSSDHVRVAVEDSGPGMTEEERAHMFDRFWQAVRKQRAGSGLGLAICKGLVEGFGGKIWAESRAGNGTTFCFTVPVAAAAPEGTSGQESADVARPLMA